MCVGPLIAITACVKPYAVIPIAALLWATAGVGQTPSPPRTDNGNLPVTAAAGSSSTLPPSPDPQISGAKPLTIEEAIAMAERNSPRLRGAAAESQRATAAVGTSRAYTNPSIEVFQGRQYARPIATPGVPGLLQHYAAYQAVEIPSERRARTKVAELA